MKSTVVVGAAFAAFIAVGSHARAGNVDPFSLYGNTLVFDVIRKGDKVGTHRVDFRRDGGDIVADTTFDVTLRVLSLPIYEYKYTSTETWYDGTFGALSATTDDNGTVSGTRVEKNGEDLLIDGPKGQATAPLGTFPTTHWNSNVVGTDKIINTITGEVNEVRMEDRGIGVVAAGHGTLKARHFAYTGDLLTEVWYDNDGRWVKMRFLGKDGTPIEYRCRECGVSAPVQSGDADSTELAQKYRQAH